MFRVLTVGQHGLLENLFGIDLFKVRLVFELLEVLAYCTLLYNIDEVSQLTLLTDFGASLLHFCLKLAGDNLTLTEVKMLKDSNFLHFSINLIQSTPLLIE